MYVDKSKFVHETWENDWYECPNCRYESIDVAHHYCPSCGQFLHWAEEEEGESHDQ